MSHKLLTLLTLRQTLEQLSPDTLLEWISWLLRQNGGAKTVVAGLFREFYNQGNNNTNQFLSDLVAEATTLAAKNTKQVVKKQVESDDDEKIDHISDLTSDLLCNIASNLPAQDVFSKWNCVSRKFIQTGLRSESIYALNLNVYRATNMEKHPPKFEINSVLKRLHSIDIDNLDLASSFIDFGSFKWPQNVRIS